MEKMTVPSMRRAGLITATVCCALAACTKEQPPTTVRQYLDDPILLEAAMLRCAQNRSETRYTAECVNAREASSRIGAAEEARRREQFEAQSEQKRQALRRAQEASARARERASEAERQRAEAELTGHFPPTEQDTDSTAAQAPSNVPHASVEPTPPANELMPAEPATDEPSTDLPAEQEMPAELPPGNEADADAPPATDDLNAVREELRRRQQSDDESTDSESP